MPNKILADTIDRRFNELAIIREPWEELWQRVVELVLPQREFTETWWARHASSHERGIREVRDKIVGREIFDGSGVSALQLLADGFQGFIVMRNAPWFKLRLEDPIANAEPLVRGYLDEVELIMSRELARSNFYDAMGEFFLDAGSVGTATIFIEEDKDDDTIVFSPRHPVEIYVAENHHHKVDVVYRKYSMTARQMTMKWSQEELSKDAWDAVHGDDANKDPEKRFNVIHAVFPRNNENPGSSQRGAGNKGMKFASVYKEENEPDIISEGGFIDNPYAVWRWAKNSYETYGRSPASNAYVDLAAVNEMGRTMLQAAQLSVEPPLNVPSEQRGRVRFVPRGNNYYEEDQTRIISPIVTGINYPIGIDYHDRMRATVREHFKVDFFLLLAQTEKRNLTATEVLELQSEKAAVLGATIGRLNSEALDPILERVYNILRRANKIPPLPNSVAPGSRLSINYVGILEQSQERLFRTQGIMRMLEQITPILNINPGLWDTINDDELARELISASGAPAKTLRSREEVAALRQERQKRAEQQRALESMDQVADIAQKTSKAPEEGSFADQLQGQLGGVQ